MVRQSVTLVRMRLRKTCDSPIYCMCVLLRDEGDWLALLVLVQGGRRRQLRRSGGGRRLAAACMARRRASGWHRFSNANGRRTRRTTGKSILLAPLLGALGARSGCARSFLPIWHTALAKTLERHHVITRSYVHKSFQSALRLVSSTKLSPKKTISLARNRKKRLPMTARSRCARLSAAV